MEDPQKKNIEDLLLMAMLTHHFITEFYKYENGNLIESYDYENEGLILLNKNNYDLNKINYFEQFYFFSLIFDFEQIYIPGDIDKNLSTKSTSYSLYCGRTNYSEPTIIEISTFNHT